MSDESLAQELERDPVMTGLSATVGAMVLVVAVCLLALLWHGLAPVQWHWLNDGQLPLLGLLVLFLVALCGWCCRQIDRRRGSA